MTRQDGFRPPSNNVCKPFGAETLRLPAKFWLEKTPRGPSARRYRRQRHQTRAGFDLSFARFRVSNGHFGECE